jgi:hypothetical protein
MHSFTCRQVVLNKSTQHGGRTSQHHFEQQCHLALPRHHLVAPLHIGQRRSAHQLVSPSTSASVTRHSSQCHLAQSLLSLSISASITLLLLLLPLLLQETLREEFSDRTLLAVAHRLHTIIEADRVLVMQQGRAVEYGAPAALLKDDAGHFTGVRALQVQRYVTAAVAAMGFACTATIIARQRAVLLLGLMAICR